MIKSIVTYVNFYFPMYKTQFYPDNFIKACLVYQFLYEKYFTQKLDMDQIIYRLTEARNYLRSDSNIITNHLIFNLAFKAFWKQYRIGRGCVYTFNSPFKECEVLSFLTGIIDWCFDKGVAEVVVE